jgi:hypothetical protein
VVLAVMLLGLAALIGRYHIHPESGTTVLAQVTLASIGHNVVFYIVQLSTTVLLALAANTSFGGLPVLGRLLATDNYLPHIFALRADRQGRILETVANQVVGVRLGVGHIPLAPRESTSLVVVPVQSVSSLTREALSAGLSLGDEVIALRVVYPDEPADMVRFREEWDAWRPDVPLALVDAPHRDLARPIVQFIQSQRPDRRIFVLIAEIEPEHLWQRLLRNNRGAVIDRAVRRDTDAIICRLRFRLRPPEPVA